MKQLAVRCFGGLDVRIGEQQIRGFESHKVKALLVYLAVHRGRFFSREQLAALLWPKKGPESARRNVRQAVYNLKSTLACEGAPSPILTRGSELGFDPEVDCWLDVDVFKEARRRSSSGGMIDPHYLTTAVALYRGDFLESFALKDSPEFEFWQLAEQESLRDQAVDVLRTLVESYMSRGEFRLGLQYARRLVSIDPLSEEAHRYLIRLYALGGRRNRSLAQYEDLRGTLLRELGVEPLEETQALYRSILADRTPIRPEEERRGVGPLIPLVGRNGSYRLLRDCWRAVLQGDCRLTLVEGEAGAGKNRLIKSFLDAASSRRLTMVLKGRCDELVPTGYQPFAQVLRNAVGEDSRRFRRAVEQISPEKLAHLALLVPELRDRNPRLPKLPMLVGRIDRERLFECFASFLEELCRPEEDDSPSEPLVLMLVELQWAVRETLDLLEYLLERLPPLPVWILGSCRTGSSNLTRDLVRRLAASEPRDQTSIVSLPRLDPKATEELAQALVGSDQATELARFLIRRSGGLPLAIAEWINSLWDECVLIHDSGRWYLTESLTGLTGDLDDLIQRRLHRLPTSTRRLASQAAIMGQAFDADLLRKAAKEHLTVVEVGLELMLERWLIRQHSDHWRTGKRERDIVLWAKGARRGNFEFNHPLIWRAVLEDVNPLRRQVMHREVGEAIEEELGEEAERSCEVLAFHFAQAGAWDRAIVHARQAIRHARTLLAVDTIRHYSRLAAKALKRLSAAAREPEAAEAWRQERSEIAAALEEIEQLDL